MSLKNSTHSQDNLSGWSCNDCQQSSTLKDAFDTLLKIALIGGIGYVAFNFESEIKDALQTIVKKVKHLNEPDTSATLKGVKKRKASNKKRV